MTEDFKFRSGMDAQAQIDASDRNPAGEDKGDIGKTWKSSFVDPHAAAEYEARIMKEDAARRAGVPKKRQTSFGLPMASK